MKKLTMRNVTVCLAARNSTDEPLERTPLPSLLLLPRIIVLFILTLLLLFLKVMNERCGIAADDDDDDDDNDEGDVEINAIFCLSF